jgi:hypothetical protein
LLGNFFFFLSVEHPPPFGRCVSSWVICLFSLLTNRLVKHARDLIHSMCRSTKYPLIMSFAEADSKVAESKRGKGYRSFRVWWWPSKTRRQVLCSVRSQVLAQQSSFKTGFSLSSLSLPCLYMYACMHEHFQHKWIA